jgi:hypothetical protein
MGRPPTEISGFGSVYPALAKREPRPAIGTTILSGAVIVINSTVKGGKAKKRAEMIEELI